MTDNLAHITSTTIQISIAPGRGHNMTIDVVKRTIWIDGLVGMRDAVSLDDPSIPPLVREGLLAIARGLFHDSRPVTRDELRELTWLVTDLLTCPAFATAVAKTLVH